MRTEEFINELMEELKDIPEADRSQMKEYYEEMICDGEENGSSEEEIIAKLGNPKDVALRLRSEYGQITRNESVQYASAPSEYQGSDAVHSIRVSAMDLAVQIRPVPSGKVQIHYQPDTSVEDFTCEEVGGVFTVMQKYHLMGFVAFWWKHALSFRRQAMLIDVPETFHGRIEIETTNGKVSLAGKLLLEQFRVRTTNSKMEIIGTDSKEIYLHTTNGSLRLEHVKAENVQLETTNGRIELSEVSCTGRLNAKSSNGRIEINRIRGREVTLKTSNGPVRGVMEGRIQNYSIQSRTTNGSNNLPRRMELPGGPVLNVNTTNGKINIDFLGN